MMSLFAYDLQKLSTPTTFVAPPSGMIQRKCACGGTPGLSGECAECRKKRLLGNSVNRKKGGGTTTTQKSAPTAKCSSADQKKTDKIAIEALNAVTPYVGLAQQALDHLHSAWIANKADLLNGNVKLSGEPVCAFNSNFNISYKDQDYGVQQIRVMFRLKHLANKVKKPVSNVCLSDKDKYCSNDKDGETQAYVVNHQAPIYYCPPFTNGMELMERQSTVLHEYTHLLPGVGDAGGYAVLGASSMTCALNLKFSAKSDDLVNTADALTGFIMHIGQANDTTVKVK